MATVILKAAKLLLNTPSLTEITTPLVVPTSALPGVPVNAPVTALKMVHEGWLVILKLNVLPASISDALGIKL